MSAYRWAALTGWIAALLLLAYKVGEEYGMRYYRDDIRARLDKLLHLAEA